MVRYVFRDTPVTGIKNVAHADPQVIGEELEAIAQASGGELKTSAIVSAARNPDSRIHKHFEWDIQKAAEQHWHNQARQLVRLISIEPDKGEPHRLFVSVSDRNGTAYRRLSDVAQSLDLANAVLKAAERDLDAFERRYRELADVCEIVARAREQLRRRLSKPPTPDRPTA